MIKKENSKQKPKLTSCAVPHVAVWHVSGHYTDDRPLNAIILKKKILKKQTV